MVDCTFYRSAGKKFLGQDIKVDKAERRVWTPGDRGGRGRGGRGGFRGAPRGGSFVSRGGGFSAGGPTPREGDWECER